MDLAEAGANGMSLDKYWFGRNFLAGRVQAQFFFFFFLGMGLK